MHPTRFKLHLAALVLSVTSEPLRAQSSSISEPVSFESALHRAIEADPLLQKLEIEEAVIDGQVEQADQRPNPVFGAEIENVLGTGDFEGFDSLEITLGLSQIFETGDKRARRTDLAKSERGLLQWEREIRLAEIEAAVRVAFVEMLLADKAHELREEQERLAKESLAETERLLEAARASEVDRTRARLEVKRRQFALAQSERQQEAARDRLASWWAQPSPSDFNATGTLRIEEPTAVEQLIGQLAETAALGRYAAERAKRKAELALEESVAKPDFEIFGGMRYVRESGGDAAFVLGIELPWTLFDRNEGNIRSARARLESVRLDQATTQRALERMLVNAHRILVNAFEESQSLEFDLRPAAEETLVETQRGYERGQFTMLAVLEAREALFEIRQNHLDALRRYASALVAIETLTRPSSL